ncbi:MAG: hypothetical protein ABSG13_18745, partial [Bryobacteraceae bacterium]
VQHQFRVYEVINAPQEHRIVIYSWAKVVGGDLRASDDISEVKFVALDELGDLPLTPLVREVLADAGYIGEKFPRLLETPGAAVPRLFAMPIAGAICRRSKRPRTGKTCGPHRIGPVYVQSSLRFELAEAD